MRNVRLALLMLPLILIGAGCSLQPIAGSADGTPTATIEVIVVTPASTPTIVTTTLPVTSYNDPTLGLTLSYPQTWFVSNMQGGFQVTSFDPSSAQAAQQPNVVTIQFSEVPNTGTDINAWVDQNIAALGTINVNIESREPVTVASTEGVRLHYTSPATNEALEHYFLILNNRYYQFIAYNNNSDGLAVIQSIRAG